MDLDVNQKVKNLYEKFPYPHYPLLAKLNWNESHLNSSDLADTLSTINVEPREAPTHSSHTKHILIAGCGEALPYVCRKVEPWSYPIVGIDLSRTSIQRAKLRNAFSFGKIDLKAKDLVAYLSEDQTPKFNHMEAFGVLHHMPEIEGFLDAFEKKSHDGCTLRIMVYNNHARKWIHEIQKFFRSVKIDFENPNANSFVQEVLNFLCENNPYIKEKITAMGDSILKNQTRLMDNFLHCFELRWNYQDWIKNFEKRNFKIIALYDRYEELDHLPNPMWSPPNPNTLEKLASIGEFEGNFEFWAIKNSSESNRRNHSTKYEIESFLKKIQIGMRLRYNLPLKLQNIAEEFGINQNITEQIWVEHLKFVYKLSQSSPNYLDTMVMNKKFNIEFFQRLARSAYIFPRQFKNQKIIQTLTDPILSRAENKSGLKKNKSMKKLPPPNKEILKAKIKIWLSTYNLCLDEKKLNLAVTRLSSILETST